MQQESLSSVHSWSVFAELGTACSSCLSVGLQGFSWGIVAGVLESNRSLARDLKKKKKKLRKMRWFGLDCPGLPASLELHCQDSFQNRKAWK